MDMVHVHFVILCAFMSKILVMIVNFEPNTSTERIKSAEQWNGFFVVYTIKGLNAYIIGILLSQ